MKTQTAAKMPEGFALVPSKSFNGQHRVRLAANGWRCTCLGASYGRMCRHVKLAREARRQRITVAELLRRLAEATAKGWCGLPTCGSCSGSFYLPCPRSEAGQAVAQRMIVNDEIARHGGILPPPPPAIADEPVERECGLGCLICPPMEVK